MPRGQFIPSDDLPYHVCCRSNNREWFFLPSAVLWELVCELWALVIERYGVKIHAFVLMTNHLHCVLSTPGANLDMAMRYFLCECAKEINRRTNRINHVFGGPYKWSLITNRYQYEQVIRYVYQNPIKAGICSRAEAYPYSTLFHLTRSKSLPFEISENRLERQSVMDSPIWQKLDWLNESFTLEQRDAVRRALTRRVLKLKHPQTMRKFPDL